MRKIITILLFVAFFILYPFLDNAFAFRCKGGTKLIEIGDIKFSVLRKCGKPKYREVIGYTLAYPRKREYKIEELVYGPKNGYFYHLIFIGNSLVKIQAERK